MSRKSGETWGTQIEYQPAASGKRVFFRFGKILSSPLRGRFVGQVDDSVGEIKLEIVTVCPYAG
jgi:hypothetical protein